MNLARKCAFSLGILLTILSNARAHHNDKITELYVATTGEWSTYNLDAHSVTADPLFIDPARGIYAVKLESPALKLGFKNFLMDQFGKPGYPMPPGFELTKSKTPVGRYAVPQLGSNKEKPKDGQKVDLGPLDVP